MRQPLACGVAAAAIGGILVASLLAVSPGGVSTLVHAAPPSTDAHLAPRDLEVHAGPGGFDGQFYYRMAVSPLSNADRLAGIEMDLPALRAQRVVYPTLVWASTAGNDDRIGVALIAVNLAAMFLLGWVGALFAVQRGRAAPWGLVFAAFPGFVYSLAFDLTEIVASVFLLLAVLALDRRRLVIASCSATLALLTRETTFVFVLALVVTALLAVRETDGRGRARELLGVAALPIGVMVVWQCWLRSRWGAFPLTSSGDNNIRLPLQGIVDSIDGLLPPSSSAAVFRLVSLGLIILVVVAAVSLVRSSRAATYEKVALALSATLMTLLSGFIWSGATTFMRAATETFVFGWIVVVSAPERAKRALVVRRGVAAAFVAVFVLTWVSELDKARDIVLLTPDARGLAVRS